jgi:hypothetical protein
MMESTAMMMTDEDVRSLENRVRRVAKQRGYYLQKSRIRDPRRPGYLGYMLLTYFTNYVVYGCIHNALPPRVKQMLSGVCAFGLKAK